MYVFACKRMHEVCMYICVCTLRVSVCNRTRTVCMYAYAHEHVRVCECVLCVYVCVPPAAMAPTTAIVHAVLALTVTTGNGWNNEASTHRPECV